MSKVTPQPKIGFVSLGCPKNLVDSERILTELRTEGYDVVPSYDDANMVGQHFCDSLNLDIAQTARIQEGCPALVGREQTFQRAGSKSGQHEDGLTPGIL